jgi:hypothetical protein
MESVHQIAGEGTSQRALAETNSTNCDHQVNPGDFEMRNNEGGSEEDESQINGPQIVQNGHAGPGDAPQLPGPQSASQKQGRQQQLGSIQWDRFLPVKTLKVLLVENDYSTRQIVTALLRNCSYEGIFLSSNHLFRYLSSVLHSKLCCVHFFFCFKVCFWSI